MEAKDVRTLMEAYASVYEGYGKKKKGDCVSKSEKGEHNCAKKVCHEQYGEGECIFGQHAVPDENGFVSHYDVQFEHGVVENVSVEELEIITEGSHNEENHRYAGEQLDEMVPALREPVKKALDAGAEFMDKNPVGQTIKKVLRPSGPGKNTPTKADQEKRIQQNNSADLYDIVKGHLIDEHNLSEDVALQLMTILDEETRTDIMEYTASVGAGPRGTTVKMTADGKEPIGDKLLRGIGKKIGGFLNRLNPNALQSNTVEPRKPLVATPKN